MFPSRCAVPLQLPEYFDGDDAQGGAPLASAPCVADNVPRLLLRQLRWLDFVLDGAALVQQLMECLQVQHRTDSLFCFVLLLHSFTLQQ